MAQPRSANPSFFLSIAKCVAVAPPTMSSEHVNSAWVVYVPQLGEQRARPYGSLERASCRGRCRRHSRYRRYSAVHEVRYLPTRSDGTPATLTAGTRTRRCHWLTGTR